MSSTSDPSSQQFSFSRIFILLSLCCMKLVQGWSVAPLSVQQPLQRQQRKQQYLIPSNPNHFSRQQALALHSTPDDSEVEATGSSSKVPNEWQGSVLSQLKQIMDPDLGVDIVTAGFIQKLELQTDDDDKVAVSFTVELTTPACPVKDQFQADCERVVGDLEWVDAVEVTMSASAANTLGEGPAGLSQVQSIIAVSSCKGGVGKSTTAVNLAFTLQQQGATVGILDADVFGPSLPTLVTPDDDIVRFVGRQIAPLQRNGVRMLSFGHVNENMAIMRGAMVTQLLEQFLDVCNWGPLDYLILDMPPGTGDVPLTLTQKLNITAAVIVTTPTELSFTDVVKGVEMFDTVQVPCVAVVENMAYYQMGPPSDNLQAKLRETLAARGVEETDALVDELMGHVQQEEIPIFGGLGAVHQERLRNQWGLDLCYRVPLETNVATQGDSGTPFVLSHPQSTTAGIYNKLAQSVVQEVSKIRYQSQQKAALEYDSERHLMVLGGSEEQENTLTPADLRRACRCALCVEELTGRQLLLPTDVSENVAPLRIQPVGNYAWSVDWSDGHASLYPERSILALMEEKKLTMA